MKITCSFLSLGCASLLAANAATIIAELPDSSQLPQTSTIARNNGNDLLNSVKGRGIGIYAGGNNNSIGNWGQSGEGTWTNNGNIADMTLCGRSRVAGDSFAMVLGGPQAGEQLSSITFSCDTPTSVISSYTMVLAVYDASGTLVQNLSAVESFTFDSTSRTTTVSLDMGNAPLIWGEGYKLVAGVRGSGGVAASAYTISGIQVSYEVVPEPATASLGALGLGALLMRRRRR